MCDGPPFGPRVYLETQSRGGASEGLTYRCGVRLGCGYLIEDRSYFLSISLMYVHYGNYKMFHVEHFVNSRGRDRGWSYPSP
jgi:hypothetical protein